MKLSDLGLVIFIGLSIAIVGMANKQLASSSSHPLELVSLRCGLSLLVSLLLLYWIVYANRTSSEKSVSFSSSDLRSTFVFIVATVLVGWALLELMKRYSNTMSILLCGSSAIICAVILSSILQNETLTSRQWIGVACLGLGLYVLMTSR
jgi:drug/metabolite transporter (DMT)-like permease